MKTRCLIAFFLCSVLGGCMVAPMPMSTGGGCGGYGYGADCGGGGYAMGPSPSINVTPILNFPPFYGGYEACDYGYRNRRSDCRDYGRYDRGRCYSGSADRRRCYQGGYSDRGCYQGGYRSRGDCRSGYGNYGYGYGGYGYSNSRVPFPSLPTRPEPRYYRR